MSQNSALRWCSLYFTGQFGGEILIITIIFLNIHVKWGCWALKNCHVNPHILQLYETLAQQISEFSSLPLLLFQ